MFQDQNLIEDIFEHLKVDNPQRMVRKIETD